MSDFFSQLNPWAKGAIIFLGIVVLFVIFNYEPSTNTPEVEKARVSEYGRPLPEASKEKPLTTTVASEENLAQQRTVQEKAIRPLPSPNLVMEINEEAQQKGKEFYSIQVASFRKSEHARTLAATLKNEGYNVEVVKQEIAGKGAWHRVYVGRYASKEMARKVLDTLQKKYNGAFLKKRQSQ